MIVFTTTIMLLLALSPALSPAQTCEDYSQYTHWISRGEFDEPANYGQAGGIAVVGNYAYVANKEPLSVGIEIFDITDPYHLVSVGSTPSPGTNSDIAVVGDRAYVTRFSNGLQVIDVHDPTNPAVIGTVSIPGNPYRVAVSGDYAYVAAYDSGLVVVDVSVDTAPVIAGSISFPLRVDDVAIQGNYAYLSNFNNLRIIDISTPSAPSLVGTLTFGSGYSDCVGVSGGYAYLGRISSGAGFYVVDVSDPTTPTFVGDVQGMSVYEFVIDGSLAYLCAGDFRIVDISKPSAPQELVRVPTRGFDVAVAGDYAFLGGGNIIVPDVQVVELGLHDVPAPLGGYYGIKDFFWIDTEGSLAFAVGFKSGGPGMQMYAIDVSTPSAPQALDSLGVVDDPYGGIDVEGGIAALVFDDLRIVDVSTPTALSLESTTPIGCCAGGVRIAGSYVYVTSSNQLTVFDISTPSTPTSAGSLVLDYSGYGLDIVGSFAYIASDYAGVQVVDLSTPSSPTLRGALSDYYFDFLTVDGDYAYCAGYYNFAVVDISDPDAPFVVATHALHGDPHGMSEAGGVVAVALLGNGTQLLDVSTPSAPAAIGTISTANARSFGVAMNGDNIIIASDLSAGGVRVYSKDCAVLSAAGDAPRAIGEAALAVSPNPFNPTVRIRFDVAHETDVTLRIYDVTGALVRTLVNDRRDARSHEVTWDGTDDSGRYVSSGVYFCRLTAGAFVEVAKAVLLK